jgi:ATP-binding cassette, subfamily B (MDR/TAP), member 1
MAVSTFLINTVTQGLLLWVGTRLIERDKLSAEVMLAFMLYQSSLQNETLNIFVCYSSFVKCCGAGDKVFALLDRKPPPPSTAFVYDEAGDSNGSVANMNGEADQYTVELKGITFRYPTRPDLSVLDNFDLVIPKGKTIALCGKVRLRFFFVLDCFMCSYLRETTHSLRSDDNCESLATFL